MVWTSRFLAALLCVLALVLAGCAGEGTNTPTPGSSIRVSLSATSVNLSPSSNHTFSATVTGTNNTAVSWSVVGGASNGAITQAGVYSAPAEPGTYTVVATSQADPGISQRATVQVQTGINLTITPQNQQIKLGDIQQFTAVITGNANTNVTWLVQGSGAGGTISPAGLYTAPLTAGTYTVSARSDADATKVVSTQVTVIPGTEVRLDSPTTLLTNVPGSTVQFTARVVGNTNQNLTWSVAEGANGGTITPEGKWTAPATPGTYTVVATSVADPTKTATRTVKVVANAKAVIVIAGRGEVTLSLNSTTAPNTVANFVSLANAGFYSGIKFHRIEPSLIQGGDPLTRTLAIDDIQIGTGGPGYTIPFENTGIPHVRGVISMARGASLDSAGSQFFIVKTDTPMWDGQYASFGTVDTGMTVVDSVVISDVITSITIQE